MYFDIIVDQETVSSAENPLPKQWTNVKVYAGLNKPHNYGVADAVIKNLQYKTLTTTTSTSTSNTTTPSTITTTTTTTTPTTTTTTKASTAPSSGGFAKVFSHDSSSGEFFASQSDALNKNSDNPDAALFSILDQLEDFRQSDGRFHFKLCYPEVTWGVDGKKCNEWYQTSNPATETTITGFEAIDLAFTINSFEKPWSGIGRSPSKWPYALIDDAPSESNWWTSIGATRSFGSASTFPGPYTGSSNYNPATTPVSKVELLVKSEDDK